MVGGRFIFTNKHQPENSYVALGLPQRTFLYFYELKLVKFSLPSSQGSIPWTEAGTLSCRASVDEAQKCCTSEKSPPLRSDHLNPLAGPPAPQH